MEREKSKGEGNKSSKIRVEQFDDIFEHVGGVGAFQAVHACLLGE